MEYCIICYFKYIYLVFLVYYMKIMNKKLIFFFTKIFLISILIKLIFYFLNICFLINVYRKCFEIYYCIKLEFINY